MGTEEWTGARIRLAVTFGVVSIASLTPVELAAAQPANYDGVYVGSQTLTENSSDKNYSECLRGPFKRRLVVKGGTASYTYNPGYQGEVTGTVSADGDVSGSSSTPSSGVDLSGKIRGDDFTGEVWSLYCTYSLQLKRAP